MDGAFVRGRERRDFVDFDHDLSDLVACAFDGHEGTVDVGERALEGGEVGDGRRAHCRDGLALGLDGT